MYNYYMNESFKHSPYLLESKLFNAITLADKKLALDIFNKINYSKKASLSRDRLRSLINSVICSITIFTRAAIDAGINDEIAFNLSDKYINLVDSCKTEDLVIKYEQEALEEYIDLISKHQKNIYSPYVLKAQKYINLHIKDKLSLSIVSKNIHVSSSYLSLNFKQEIGKSITKYINELKIKESLYLLKTNDASITKITNEYNFCNESYYIDLFKKIYMFTPKEYLKNINIQNSERKIDE